MLPTWWNATKAVAADVYALWESHGTKILGFLQVTLAALVAVPQVIPAGWLPALMAATGVLTAWRGFVNSQRQP